jgi:hypothetical protein
MKEKTAEKKATVRYFDCPLGETVVLVTIAS